MKLSSVIVGFLMLACAGCGQDEAAAVHSSARTVLECKKDDPEVLGSVAPFHFTSSDGRTVTEQDLLGKVWVVDFFFTTCSGPCPRITTQMRALQDDLAGSKVQLVSISVDPATDTPEALRDYAQRVGADTSRWWFLTGDETATFELIRSSFALPVERASEAQIGFQVSHATRLVVVDARGKVRGYYAGETPEGRAMARERAQWLAQHLDS
ncbi:MAG TPA: SCO family protein [Planctomycetota bacterium]|nr:SCO family protein [Planctomycetota bacterium]